KGRSFLFSTVFLSDTPYQRPAPKEWVLRTKLMSVYLGAKDLPERISANVNHAALVPTDPSRELS
ncbi:MAG TPA: hypothetical protein VK589_11365, partial [Chryseolinea sp.]|nr:hypothetical protein [Chryseolinea sp.]